MNVIIQERNTYAEIVASPPRRGSRSSESARGLLHGTVQGKKIALLVGSDISSPTSATLDFNPLEIVSDVYDNRDLDIESHSASVQVDCRQRTITPPTDLTTSPQASVPRLTYPVKGSRDVRPSILSAHHNIETSRQIDVVGTTQDSVSAASPLNHPTDVVLALIGSMNRVMDENTKLRQMLDESQKANHSLGSIAMDNLQSAHKIVGALTEVTQIQMAQRNQVVPDVKRKPVSTQRHSSRKSTSSSGNRNRLSFHPPLSTPPHSCSSPHASLSVSALRLEPKSHSPSTNSPPTASLSLCSTAPPLHSSARAQSPLVPSFSPPSRSPADTPTISFARHR